MLLTDDLQSVPKAIRLSFETMKVIQQNLLRRQQFPAPPEGVEGLAVFSLKFPLYQRIYGQQNILKPSLH